MTATLGLAVLLGGGTNGFTPAASSPELTATLRAVADLDADGYVDLVGPDSASTFRILHGSATGDFTLFGTEPLDQGLAAAGATDFDGDADVDLALGDFNKHVEILLSQVNQPTSPGGPDTDPPETTITKGPKRKLPKTKARLEFSSDEPGSTFECRLKGKRAKKALKQFASCSSPLKYERLKLGKFKFQVRAIDAAHNVDQTPSKKKFKRVP